MGRIEAAAHPLQLELLERFAAVILILIGLPLFVPIAAAILVTSGRPIFHRGVRLGRHRKPFRMYKFRTLVHGADRVIGGRLLSWEDDLTTPLGSFLRETRLDELPQLLNILTGDMSFVGPRPERPEVYESQCRSMPGYEARFEVKPGLIGHSQLFTPHSTPKRIRAIIDRRMIRRGPRPVSNLLLVAYTTLVVAASLGRNLLGLVRNDLLRRRILRRYSEKRRHIRIHPRGAVAIASMNGAGTRCLAPVLDISDTSFVMVSGEQFDELWPHQFDLVIRIGSNGRSRRVRASCRGRVTQVRPTRAGFEHVVSFKPATDRSMYVLHQHFLRRSLAPPPA